tara:strand:+ start:1157 stop:1555 length:399 start_codon:yes stop_codon:yes gene_type:complete
VITPFYGNQNIARYQLLKAMDKTDYQYKDKHQKIIDYSIILECVNKHREVAGYIWFYKTRNAETKWVAHVLVYESFQKKFFTRTLVNSVFAFAWVMGAEEILTENFETVLNERMGAKLVEGQVIYKLPHEWR